MSNIIEVTTHNQAVVDMMKSTFGSPKDFSLHVEQEEIQKIEPPITDWSRERFGYCSHGYIQANSPLVFLNNSSGFHWKLMVLHADPDSVDQNTCWILGTTRSAGARNFILQTLLAYPDLMPVLFSNQRFQALLDLMDPTLHCYKGDDLDVYVVEGLDLIENGLRDMANMTEKTRAAMLQR